ncbi:MAG: hypothetical protein N2111_09940 [Candidatus Sumerlaeaceae bacterium]|nr:hypothetical protein [Candidatus Sumerlaeaceae bacterium]
MKRLFVVLLALVIGVGFAGCGRREEPERETTRVNRVSDTRANESRRLPERRGGERVATSTAAAETTATLGAAASTSTAPETSSDKETTAPAATETSPSAAAGAEPPVPRPVVAAVEPREFVPPPPGSTLPLKMTITGSNLGKVRVFLREGEEEAALTVDEAQSDEQRIVVTAGPFSSESRGPYDIVLRNEQGTEVVVPQALQARP